MNMKVAFGSIGFGRVCEGMESFPDSSFPMIDQQLPGINHASFQGATVRRLERPTKG